MANGAEESADEGRELTDQTDEELGFSMPEFKVPTEVNDAVEREDLGPKGEEVEKGELDSTQAIPKEALDAMKKEWVEGTIEDSFVVDPPIKEEKNLVFDREELVKTRDMRAFSRADFHEPIKIDALLTDQRFAPDILVRPPRVLTKKWQEGGHTKTEKDPEPTVKIATVNRAEGNVSTPFGEMDHQKSVAATQQMAAPSQTDIDGKKALKDPASVSAELEIDPDSFEIEEVKAIAPPSKPTPPPVAKNPAKVSAQRPAAHRPPPRPEAENASTDEELNGIVQDLLDEKKQKTRPVHPTAEDERRSGWCHTLFDEEYLRTLPKDLKNETAREVEFIKRSLGLKSGARVLDLACGFGRHAVELAQEGLEVAGLDLSIDLLQHALAQAKKRNLSIKFIHGDMRELNFSEIFDGCYCWQTSFGYFNDRTNVGVLEGINRSLKMGGRVLIDTINRDHVVARMPTRTWWEGIECVFLEEVEFDFSTSILQTKRSFIYDGAPPREYKSFIRLYSLHEMKRILGYCGFRVIEVSGEVFHRGAYLGPASRRSIILAEKIAPVQK